MSQERFVVRHDAEARKYLLIDSEAESAPEVIGEEAYVDLERDGKGERIFFHTEVSEDYTGQGLASVLVRDAVEQALADGYRIVPVCPYVAKWFAKHAQYSEHVVKPAPAHLQAVGKSPR